MSALPPAGSRIHFVGIGGIGMSGLARMMQSMGYVVSGSDSTPSALIDELRALGIAIETGHAAGILPEGIDRNGVRARIYETHKIEMGALYSPPCHKMPVFSSLAKVPLPNADRYLPRQICLPMHARVTDAEAERSVSVLKAAIS